MVKVKGQRSRSPGQKRDFWQCTITVPGKQSVARISHTSIREFLCMRTCTCMCEICARMCEMMKCDVMHIQLAVKVIESDPLVCVYRSILHGKRTLGQRNFKNTDRGRCVNAQAFSLQCKDRGGRGSEDFRL